MQDWKTRARKGNSKREPLHRLTRENDACDPLTRSLPREGFIGCGEDKKNQLVDRGLASPSLLGKQTGLARGKGAGPGRQ
jgi:hypothetical protein